MIVFCEALIAPSVESFPWNSQCGIPSPDLFKKSPAQLLIVIKVSGSISSFLMRVSFKEYNLMK